MENDQENETIYSVAKPQEDEAPDQKQEKAERRKRKFKKFLYALGSVIALSGILLGFYMTYLAVEEHLPWWAVICVGVTVLILWYVCSKIGDYFVEKHDK